MIKHTTRDGHDDHAAASTPAWSSRLLEFLSLCFCSLYSTPRDMAVSQPQRWAAVTWADLTNTWAKLTNDVTELFAESNSPNKRAVFQR